MRSDLAPATVLGIDVGGTGVKAVAASTAPLDDRGLLGAVLAERRVPTPQGDPSGRALADAIVELVRWSAAATGAAPAHLAVVVPGIVEPATATVRLAVNLGWRDLPLGSVVGAALDAAGIAVPVSVGQDVRAGALAEARGLAARPGVVAFVPLGTGLALALVRDGAPADAPPWAGEIGQVRIRHGRFAGLRVEEIASAGGVARALGVPTAREVADRVVAGDPEATAVWQECVDVLAEALAWTAAITGSGVVVVGGGLAESGALLLDPLRAALADRLVGLDPPSVVPAAFGDRAGALGAVHLARDAAYARGASSPRTADADGIDA